MSLKTEHAERWLIDQGYGVEGIFNLNGQRWFHGYEIIEMLASYADGELLRRLQPEGQKCGFALNSTGFTGIYCNRKIGHDGEHLHTFPAEAESSSAGPSECGFRMSLPDNTGGAIYCNKEVGHSGDHGHTFQQFFPASQQVSELLAADVQRAKDISRLTVERDEAREQRDELQRKLVASQQVDVRAVAKEIDKYYQVFEETPEEQRISDVAAVLQKAMGAAAPRPDRELLEAVAEDGLLVTWDKDYKFNFSQVVRLMAEFAEEQISSSERGAATAQPEEGKG